MVCFYLLNKLTRCTHRLSGFTEKFVLQSKARSLTCYAEVLAVINEFEGSILSEPGKSTISQSNYRAVTLASQKGYVTGRGSNLGPIKFNLITKGGVLEDVLGLEDTFSSPWPRSFKSLASKPQVLENCPVLGSRTALFFKRLKFRWKTPETSRKICEHVFCFPHLEHRRSQVWGGGAGSPPHLKFHQ